MSQASSEEMLVVPSLGFVTGMVSVAVWLVREGASVLAGDRVVQLVAGAATIDLVAPITGRLQRQLVDEDDRVEPGDPLAVFAHAGVAKSGTA
jgi:pyruvate/2-oxoglutarate dehydrogenase complex dihydrolipoamide acyltransferase (E2) component